MIQVQLHTGMRPGEVVLMRPVDIDLSGGVWVYKPFTHKTEHHGKQRTVAIGPRAQSVLRPWLTRDLSAYLFSPKAEAQGNLMNGDRSRRGLTIDDRRRPPGDRYCTRSYGRAIERACQRVGIDVWSPNRLRHSAATRLRREFGIEAAQVVLGHSKMDVTSIYAERNLDKAIEIAMRVG